MEEQHKRLPNEVVEVYEPKEREVVEVYVHATPLPGKKEIKPKKRKKKGLYVFLACLSVLLILAGLSWWFTSQSKTAYYLPFDSVTQKTKISIPTYPTGQGVTVPVAETHGPHLSPQEIFVKMNPSVVTVLAGAENQVFVGTGVIFTSDGYILTNYHIVEGGSTCHIALSNGGVYEAQYVAGDQENDIAVLKVDLTGLPPAEIGNSDDLVVGDTVYAIGNPLGVELRGTFTDGIVSAINRDVQIDDRVLTLIQTNAAMNTGNSGGPLINCYGQVIGINTIKMTSSEGNVEGLGFALPTGVVRYMVDDLLTVGKIIPEPILGVTVNVLADDLSNGKKGVEVFSVTPESAAEVAGIQEGDYLLTADGTPLRDSNDLLRVRHRFNVGDQMEVTIWRDGRELTVTLLFKE